MLESKYLKDNIENIQKLLAIPALKNFETKSLQKLLRLSKIREYENGELIIEEGDLDPWLYFLLSGKIRIRVAGPPHRFPCHYGIDFSTRGELIAAQKTVEELRGYLGLDSLHYLSIDGLLKSTGIENPEKNFCKACFDGCYPVAFDENLTKACLETT